MSNIPNTLFSWSYKKEASLRHKNKREAVLAKDKQEVTTRAGKNGQHTTA